MNHLQCFYMLTYNGLIPIILELQLACMLVIDSTMLPFLDQALQTLSILMRLVILVYLEYGSLKLVKVCDWLCIMCGIVHHVYMYTQHMVDTNQTQV